MSKIQVLGPGCPKCQALYERVRQASAEMGIDCEVEKISDLDAILRFGILSTPALVVDGAVRVNGRVPTVAQLKEILG